jgi:hypothetical protein
VFAHVPDAPSKKQMDGHLLFCLVILLFSASLSYNTSGKKHGQLYYTATAGQTLRSPPFHQWNKVGKIGPNHVKYRP